MLEPINNMAQEDVKRRIIGLKVSLLTRCGLELPFIMFDDERREYYKALKNGQRQYVSAQEAFDDEQAHKISDEDSVKRACLSVEIALMEMRELGIPIAVYEPESGKIYREKNDGTLVEVLRRA